MTIGAVESFITETAFQNGWIKPPIPNKELAQSVGIIGGGPAGLAAAEILRRTGYQVHIYDRYDRIGGLLIYGIPNFKLDKEIVERRVSLYEEAGIRMHCSQGIGDKESFHELRKRHDAILISTGVYKARDIKCRVAV